MKTETRRYSSGDIIFREGEASDSAFVIEAGQVELIKSGRAGLVRLSMLGKGDLFGEMGVLDKGPRSATARAEGEVTVKIIPRDEFLRAVQDDPQTALKIMARMARRLRDTDERLANSSPQPAGPSVSTALVTTAQQVNGPTAAGTPGPMMAGPPRGTLLQRLVSAFRPLRGTMANQARPRVVGVTPLSLDPEFDQRPYLIEALGGIPGITIKATTSDLPPPDEGEVVRDPIRARLAARQIVVDEKLDLLIWGGEDETGRVVELHFAPATLPEVERLAAFPPDGRLVVPADFDEAWSPLFKAAMMAALGEAGNPLPSLVVAAMETGLAPPEGMSGDEQASVLVTWAFTALLAGLTHRKITMLDQACQAFQRAIPMLPRDADAEWSLIHRTLGLALESRAESGAANATDLLKQAATAYQTAIDSLRRDTDGRIWGVLHARLGAVMFRIDLKTGDDATLKAAIQHYQAAAQVFTRTDHPWRWAEIMNSLGQALQVYGDHLKSTAMLAKAVEILRSATEVRTAEAAPLLYATTRNNQGSALFMLAKHTSDPEAMRLAAVAFQDALSVYNAAGGRGGLAYTIEKNLDRAEILLRRQAERTVAQPAWATVDGPETVPEDDASEEITGLNTVRDDDRF